MLNMLNLRTRILLLFAVMAIIVGLGGSIMFWYTWQIDHLFGRIVNRDIVLYNTAKEMELALANQKGFLTYYFVDGNTKWLRSLGQYRRVFDECLERTDTFSLPPEQRQLLSSIKNTYQQYITTKDRAIESYNNQPSHGTISLPHEKQRDTFFNLLEKCQSFSQNQWQIIQNTEEAGNDRTRLLRVIAFGGSFLFIGVGVGLLFIVYKQILEPIRRLAIKTGGGSQENISNEVDALKSSLNTMLRDFDETSDELARSRRNLLQAERMALVGELAAGVAHTIRNPFTSIKMRLFSLSRSLHLDEVQAEDMQVIADEINRIDTIVQNFLEFARPPKLRLEVCQLSQIVRSVLALLEFRLKKYDVTLNYNEEPTLPALFIDADRIKEALVNLIINCCEAMGSGGRIDMSASIEKDAPFKSILISVADNGPGIPKELIDKVTVPFFTTKEDGSGLGLSIVKRIVKEHQGRLEISSTPGAGTTCRLILPIEGVRHESGPHH